MFEAILDLLKELLALVGCVRGRGELPGQLTAEEEKGSLKSSRRAILRRGTS